MRVAASRPFFVRPAGHCNFDTWAGRGRAMADSDVWSIGLLAVLISLTAVIDEGERKSRNLAPGGRHSGSELLGS